MTLLCDTTSAIARACRWQLGFRIGLSSRWSGIISGEARLERRGNIWDRALTCWRVPAVNRSALLAMAAGGRVNATTISWGMLGVEWAKPVFITFVCKGRFSRTPAGQDGRVCHWHPRRGLRPHDSGACGQRVWERRRQDQGAGAACGGSTDCLGARHIRGINYAGMLRCASSTAGS